MVPAAGRFDIFDDSAHVDGMTVVDFEQVAEARRRIVGSVHRTPVVSSHLLNHWLGHEVFFKAECLQKVGAFKARGALNAVAAYIETHGKAPKRVIANSSGNHAQAVAWSCNEREIPCTIYMPEDTSAVKVQGTRSYGAEVVLLPSRMEVDAATESAAREDGVFWIPPYNHEWVIAGQGTVVAEALEQIEGGIDAVFAPCGGGGLLSGSLVSGRQLDPQMQVIGVEPANADDAFRSREKGKIVKLDASPNTLADGARTLSLGSITFPHVQQADGFYRCSEDRLIYWTQWLNHLLKLRIEPTGAMATEGLWQWMQTQDPGKRVLVILSGGNMDAKTCRAVWDSDYLDQPPVSVGEASS